MERYRRVVEPMLKKYEGSTLTDENSIMGVKFSTWQQIAINDLHRIPTYEDFLTWNWNTPDYWLVVKYFWKKAGCESIPNDDKALIIFQAIWGSGQYGIVVIQKRLGLEQDGIVGKKTINAVNNTDALKLWQALYDYYERLWKQPKYSKYENGWKNRINYIKPNIFLATFNISPEKIYELYLYLIVVSIFMYLLLRKFYYNPQKTRIYGY